MPDEMDRVQEQSEQILADILGEHKRKTYVTSASLDTCCVCGDSIPEARQKAMPGVCKCIVCQSEWESMHGRGA